MLNNRHFSPQEQEGNRLNRILGVIENLCKICDPDQKLESGTFDKLNEQLVRGIYCSLGDLFQLPISKPNGEFMINIKDYETYPGMISPASYLELPIQTQYEISQFTNRPINNPSDETKIVQIGYNLEINYRGNSILLPRELTLVTSSKFFHLEILGKLNNNRVVVLSSPNETWYTFAKGSSQRRASFDEVEKRADEKMIYSRAYLLNSQVFLGSNSMYKDYLQEIIGALKIFSEGIRGLIRT